MPPGMGFMMKGHLVGMSMSNKEYKFHISSFPVAKKQTNISYTRDNTLHMISETRAQKKDEGGLRKDRIKGYTKEHIEFLQSKSFGTMFGTGARHAYPKTGKVRDSLGNVRLVLYVRVGTKVNIITHVKSSSHTRDGEISNFGQRGVGSIGASTRLRGR
jgi:hypothetical protein